MDADDDDEEEEAEGEAPDAKGRHGEPMDDEPAEDILELHQ